MIKKWSLKMKHCASVFLASALLLSAGCAMKQGSKAEHYNHVQVLDYPTIESLAGTGNAVKVASGNNGPARIDRYINSSIHEDSLYIEVYDKRNDKDPYPTIATSTYKYRESNGHLELVEHVPTQTGLIGNWAIPVMKKSYLKELERSSVKPDSDQWKETRWNHFLKKQSEPVSLMISKARVTEGVYFKPTISVFQPVRDVRGCLDIGIKPLDQYEKWIKINGIPFYSWAECAVDHKSVKYTLPARELASLQKFESQNDEVLVQLPNGQFNVPLKGLTYLLTVSAGKSQKIGHDMYVNDQ
jgi:hypothetical protein